MGEKLTAEQWLDRYQWGRYTKMIVGGGIINGSVALSSTMRWSVTARRAAISVPAPPTRTIWPPSRRSRITRPWQTPGVSDQTRIADALEDMVAAELPDAE